MGILGICRFNEIVNVTSTNRQCALVNSQCGWCMFWFDWIHLGFLGQVAEKDNVIKQMKEEVGKKQLGIKKADLRVWLWLQFYFWCVFVAQLWGILLVHKMTILWIHRGTDFGRKFQSLDHCQYFSVSWDWWKDLHRWVMVQDSPAHPGGCAAAEGEGVVKQKSIVDIEMLHWNSQIIHVKGFQWILTLGTLFWFFLPFYSCVYCTITNKKIDQWTSLVAFNWPNGALKILTSAKAVDSMSEMCFWVFGFLPHCRIHKSPSDRHPTTHHDPLCAAFTVLWGFGHYTQVLKIVFCFFLKYFFFFGYFCPALRRR